MREALVKSLNLVTVRILMGTGIDPAVRHIKAFGFNDTAVPRNLSMALGSGGASPWDMATGYAVFANGGRRVQHYVVDRVYNAAGQVVYEASPARACEPCAQTIPVIVEDAGPGSGAGARTAAAFAVDSAELRPGMPLEGTAPPATAGAGEVPDYATVEEMIEHGMSWRAGLYDAPGLFRGQRVAPRVISAENAYLVYDMMRDVIRRGTGRRARDLGRDDIAGKTGTSNERRDTWFSGFNAELVATAWVGFDQERSLGEREEGGQTALPMWKYFMARALRSTPESPLAQPAELITARISPTTGQLAAAGDGNAIFELFRTSDLAALEGGVVSNPASALQAGEGDIF
jgi:penicillin-binding protein 1A